MARHRLDWRKSKGEGRERAPRPSLNLSLRRMRPRFCVDIAFSAVVLGLLVLSFTSLAQVKITGGFKYPWYEKPGPDHPNRLVTLITGTDAELLPNDISLVKQMRLEHYPEDGITNLIATAPECLLDAANRTASSTNRIELRTASGLFIEGQFGRSSNRISPTGLRPRPWLGLLLFRPPKRVTRQAPTRSPPFSRIILISTMRPTSLPTRATCGWTTPNWT